MKRVVVTIGWAGLVITVLAARIDAQQKQLWSHVSLQNAVGPIYGKLTTDPGEGTEHQDGVLSPGLYQVFMSAECMQDGPYDGLITNHVHLHLAVPAAVQTSMSVYSAEARILWAGLTSGNSSAGVGGSFFSLHNIAYESLSGCQLSAAMCDVMLDVSGTPAAQTDWEFNARVRATGVGPCTANDFSDGNWNLGDTFVVATQTAYSIDYSWDLETAIGNVPSAGSLQSTPFLPLADGSFPVDPCSPWCWYDPPLAYGYEFASTSASKFAAIVNFPVGIDSDGVFIVGTGGKTLGTFHVGESVDFVGLTGSSVPSFEVLGIAPFLDGTNPTAFPIQLSFDPAPGTFTMTPIDAGAPWSDLGSGLAGVGGVPKASGAGSLTAGSLGSLSMSAAKPSTLSMLFTSLTSTPLPLKGGVLVPVPSAIAVILATDGSGGVSLPFTWPGGIPSSTTLYFQFAVSDAAAVHGVSLSNALLAITP